MSPRSYPALALLSALLLAACDTTDPVGPPALEPATYAVTLEATWSAQTHPADFPANPHFSRLVGATHAADVTLWAVGENASGGLQDVAERGVNSRFESEVAGLGEAAAWVEGPGIALSPGQTAVTLTVSAEQPLVSLVSMLAPSPDWFVGVSGLDLRSGTGWQDELVIDLVVYDAGTDDGASYAAPNAPAMPAEAVAVSDHPYFNGNTVQRTVGTLTLRRTDG